jgi:hypothetical protein
MMRRRQPDGSSGLPGTAGLDRERRGVMMKGKPDLRTGDPRAHDLVAEIDEAIDAGDEPRVEELSRRLREIDPAAGAGSDT